MLLADGSRTRQRQPLQRRPGKSKRGIAIGPNCASSQRAWDPQRLVSINTIAC